MMMRQETLLQKFAGAMAAMPPRIHRYGRLASGRRAGTEAGFTLIEVIVALAILSVGLSTLLGLISSTLRQIAHAERAAEARSLVQSLMAEVGTGLPIAPGERDGQYANGFRWHLKMEPFGNAREREEWPLGVYTISAEVEWDDGAQRRSQTLSTLRLGPKEVRP